ncbi:MAG TPA: hypothetical protein VLH56_04085 [Dissulfurispiraceae bacterium]|nr:hypothetical protein [Dissulfurispiraceae bacterium]
MTTRPLILCIGGEKSNIGKTTLGAAFIRSLVAPSSPDDTLVLLKPPKRFGAIKYTKTAFYASITDDPHLIEQPDKDTAEYRAAGAERVLWVQAPPEQLQELMPQAMDMLSDLDIIMVEGNSPIEFLRPDGVICIVSSGAASGKPSARKALQIADLLVSISAEQPLNMSPAIFSVTLSDLSSGAGADGVHRLIRRMDDILIKKKIAALLTERAENGRISCTAARAVAEEIGISYALIGAAADELKIKVKQCELGCF